MKQLNLQQEYSEEILFNNSFFYTSHSDKLYEQNLRIHANIEFNIRKTFRAYLPTMTFIAKYQNDTHCLDRYKFYLIQASWQFYEI